MGLASRILHHRRLMRSPLLLRRLGADRLLGSRLVLLEHRGRTSGLLRQVVLEVVDRPDVRTWRVVSGLGRSSHWFRNITTDPRIRVTSGAVKHRPGRAVVLGPDHPQATLDRYAAVHPHAWARLQPVLQERAWPGQALSEVIPVVDLVLDADARQPMPPAPKASPSR
ncbi:MAG: nitroreductase family deazaflavin-dependent oxidoreductase [Ornithinimicrobium sp.]|uniref:nitroreductase family deazaflavin-dependent oxidoreductase n=1 Tax=Ornithinimicrobium sp. TaxID=1977084 RepID=UPI003D9ACBB2